jgi:hypothetical protein
VHFRSFKASQSLHYYAGKCKKSVITQCAENLTSKRKDAWDHNNIWEVYGGIHRDLTDSMAHGDCTARKMGIKTLVNTPALAPVFSAVDKHFDEHLSLYQWHS